MNDLTPKRTTRPLRYLELIEDHIDSLISGRCPNAFSMVTIVKDELEAALRGLDSMPPGVEKTERAQQITALEEKFLEWEKGRHQ